MTPTEPYHVFGYARMSTLAQYLSTKAQRAKIDKYYAFRFDDDEDATWGGCYEDHAVSATRVDFRDRPHGLELNLKLNRGDHILLALGDRAFRSVADCCLCIKDWTKRGVILHYLNANFDTSTASGRMIAQIIASMGEYEGELRSERQRERNNIARSHGLPTNAHCPWGWKIIGTKQTRRFVEVWSDRSVANMILSHIDQGWSYEALAHDFNSRPDPPKAKGYNGRGKPWTVAGCFNAAKAAKADFPDPRERKEAS
ncbi:MAG: recombinase family protein [Planctomycetes bacterium]|nr:recombinase family protein [Planctomycetota bacterium]